MASKVAHNGPQTFFHKYCLAAKTSPELIFHIIKWQEQESVILSVKKAHRRSLLSGHFGHVITVIGKQIGRQSQSFTLA